MLSILDLEDCITNGRIRAQNIHAEIRDQMQQPLRAAMLKSMFASMTPEQMQALEQMQPDALRKVKEEFLGEYS